MYTEQADYARHFLREKPEIMRLAINGGPVGEITGKFNCITAGTMQ